MRILVLMSTYNGEKYLEEQLNSIFTQEEVEVEVLVRDDGSKDGTLEILSKYMKNNKLSMYQGENLGPAYSFFDLLKKAKNVSMEFDYYCFSDQDDVWKSKKLIEATSKCQLLEKGYQLYVSSLDVVNENLNYQKTLNVIKYEFPEFLFRNQCAGCTMVFNYATLCLITKYYPRYLEMHDVWLLRVLLCTNNSKIYYDKNSYILYRQHSDNVVGTNNRLIFSFLIKLKQLFDRNGKAYITARELMQGYENELTDEAKQMLVLILNIKSIRGKINLLKYIKKYNFSNTLRKVFFIWNVLYGNL